MIINGGHWTGKHRADHGIVVKNYSDEAEGFMEEIPGQGGRFTSVILKPSVIITDRSQVALANSLHEAAGKKYFIANSCNFPVSYTPVCQGENE
jgi:organic hydroperoxide reductase OsmC/OhrA